MDNEGTLLADGYEAAFIGVVEQRGKTIAVYDRDRCIEILIERDGMDHEEAEEFFEFNTAGAYVGEQTPLYLQRCTLDELNDG